jgi:hypothetical protein
LNEWEIMREKLDADDFERYVRLKLNSWFTKLFISLKIIYLQHLQISLLRLKT